MTEMKLSFIAFAILISIIWWVTALAQDQETSPAPLTLREEQGKYPLGTHLELLEDPTGNLTIEDVTRPEYSQRFVPSQDEVPNFGYTHSSIWAKLRLRNESRNIDHWLLEVGFANLPYIDLYLPSSDNGGFLLKQSGGLRPFNTRDIPYHNVILDLPLAHGDEQTVYLLFSPGASMTLALTLWSPGAFIQYIMINQLLLGVFYGALLILLGYNIFLLFSLRDINYLYYVLFLASAILFIADFEGLAVQYLWPFLYAYRYVTLAIFFGLFIISLILFSDNFLKIKTLAPGLHKAIIAVVIVGSFLIPIAPVIGVSAVPKLMVPWGIVTIGVALWAGIIAFRKGFRPARYYLISWVGLLLGVLSMLMVRERLIPSTPITELLYYPAMIWLGLFWSLALAEQINLLKAETEEANSALRESESRLSQYLEAMPVGVVVYGKDLILRYFNQRTAKILSNPERGLQPDLQAGRTLEQAAEYFSLRLAGSEEAYPLENFPITKALKGETSSVDNVEADLGDWRVPLEISSSPIFDEQQTVQSVITAFQDISGRKRAEAQLVNYRDHLEEMVKDRTNELYQRVEELSALIHISGALAAFGDFPKALEIVAANIAHLFDSKLVLIAELDPAADLARFLVIQDQAGLTLNGKDHKVELSEESNLRKVLSAGKPILIPEIHSSGVPEPLCNLLQGYGVHACLFVPLTARSTLIGFIAMEYNPLSQEYSEEKLTLVELIANDIAKTIENIRLYEEAKVLAVTEERNRLARDLHDSVTQSLFSANLVAEILPKILRRDAAQAEQSLEELRRLTKSALAEMRTLLLELRPAYVTQTPLGELITQLTEVVRDRSEIPVQLYVESIPSLPEQVHIAFYRIAQEALNNIVKHARASQVWVSLRAIPLMDNQNVDNWQGQVKLEVSDDGVGITGKDDQPGHMGFAIMRERAAEIHADLTLDSHPGKGTKLVLVWKD